MNILVFSWRDPKHPQAGGAEQVMHEHMKGWIEAGHHVTLFSSEYIGCSKDEILDGVNIIRSGHQYLDVQIRGCYWYFCGKHKKFDLVVDQFHGLPFFTPLYVRVKKMAVLQEVAKEVWLVNHLPKPFNWIIGVMGYLFEPLIFLLYRNVHFMTGSQSAKNDLIKFGIRDKNITIVPHGVIITIPKVLPKREKKKTIIFLGALTRDKGVEDAIETFGLLSKVGDFNFWIIGKSNSEYLSFLRERCQILKITNRVKFWGFISQSEKFQLLARAHLLINPSLREGWGLVNIEANAMGVPVVAYNSPGLVDSVKNDQSGIIVCKNNPAKLAETINKILDNKVLFKKLEIGSKKWAEKFSWKISSKESLSLIERLIKKN